MKTETNNAQDGLNCPNCNQFRIRFTIHDLLTKNTVCCPGCNTQLEMTVPQEMKKHLQEISLAERMVKEARHFSR